MAENNKILDISWETILKIAVAGLVFYLIYLTRNILIWVIFALIISVLFNPAIDFLKRFIPRTVAVVFIYVAVFGILGLSVYLIAPIFVSEMRQFSQLIPEYFDKISPPLRGLGIGAFENFETFNGALEKSLADASSSIFSALGVIFGGIFSTVTILAISLFLSLEENGIDKAIKLLSPKRYEALVFSLWEKSQRKVAGWFGARILGSIFVGATTYLACYFLNIEYAVSFGIFAGVLNFVPIAGPVVSGAIMALIVGASAWLKAGFFLVAFVLIQQIEGNVLSPVLTRKFIGLPPALVLIALIAGAKLWGMMGAFLAIPIAGIFFEFIRDFLQRRKEDKTVML